MIARIAPSVPASIAVLGASIAVGLTVVATDRLTITVLLLLLATALLVIRRSLFFWDVLILALGGTLVLGYGFANVGLASAVPVPLVDVLLGLLLIGVVAIRPPRSIAYTLSIVFGSLFVFLAAIRLAVDFPVWGTPALRDFTLVLELGFVLVGFWAVRVYGIERCVRSLRWVFLLCLAYFLFYPARDQLAVLGPVVGLQRPVPLIGSYAGAGTAAASAFFFCTFLRPFGQATYAFAAGFVGLIALFQSRGLYLGLPLAAAVTWILAGRWARIRPALGISLATGVLALCVLFLAAPTGRLGTVSPAFLRAQLETLTGGDGPGAGSLQQRKVWFNQVVERVETTPGAWAFGVGLGPDLAGGFRVSADAAVRKPHDDYLEVFARLGLAGFLLFAGFLFSLLRPILGAARRAAGREAAFLWWVFATALVYLLVAATQPLLAFPYGTVPLFTALGAGLGVARNLQDTPRPTVSLEAGASSSA